MDVYLQPRVGFWQTKSRIIWRVLNICDRVIINDIEYSPKKKKNPYQISLSIYVFIYLYIC